MFENGGLLLDQLPLQKWYTGMYLQFDMALPCIMG